MSLTTLLIHNSHAYELKIETLSKEKKCSLWKDLFKVVLHVQFRSLTSSFGFWWIGIKLWNFNSQNQKTTWSFGIHFHTLVIVCLNFKIFFWPTFLLCFNFGHKTNVRVITNVNWFFLFLFVIIADFSLQNKI